MGQKRSGEPQPEAGLVPLQGFSINKIMINKNK